MLFTAGWPILPAAVLIPPGQFLLTYPALVVLPALVLALGVSAPRCGSFGIGRPYSCHPLHGIRPAEWGARAPIPVGSHCFQRSRPGGDHTGGHDCRAPGRRDRRGDPIQRTRFGLRTLPSCRQPRCPPRARTETCVRGDGSADPVDRRRSRPAPEAASARCRGGHCMTRRTWILAGPALLVPALRRATSTSLHCSSTACWPRCPAHPPPLRRFQRHSEVRL